MPDIQEKRSSRFEDEEVVPEPGRVRVLLPPVAHLPANFFGVSYGCEGAFTAGHNTNFFIFNW
jgi:hypothetical protein